MELVSIGDRGETVLFAVELLGDVARRVEVGEVVELGAIVGISTGTVPGPIELTTRVSRQVNREIIE